MEIIEKRLTELTPYKNNPRKNDQAVDAVAASIKAFGFKVPVVIDKKGEIVCGHTRVKAAKKLKLESVPCVVADDLTAEWDLPALDLELADLDFDMGEFGFGLLDDDYTKPDEVKEDDFDEEPPAEPKAKRGDIYILGNHRLMCGDSTSAEDVAKLMDGEKADLLLTDPPYNVAYVGKTKDAMTIKNDSMDDESFALFLQKSFQAADAVMENGACFYIWHADSEGFNFRKACKEAGWKLRETLVWNKNSMVLGRQDYQWKHEPCLYGWKDGSHKWYGDRKQTTVIDMNRPNASKLHPTMKPVALFAYQIQNSTQKGDIVLDTFGGSGTSIIACEQLGRKCYTMELDPRYVDVIIARWEKFTGRKAEKI